MADPALLTGGQRGGLRIALGAILVLLGLAALLWLGVALLVVAMLFGPELIAFGLVSVVAAIVVLSSPGDSLVLLARIGGVILLLLGVVTLFSVFAGRTQSPVKPTTSAPAH
jgi:uncharacterized membrane protein HdeD (DUF308 family)